jgi:hypothetical protein
MQNDANVFKTFFETHCINEPDSWVDLLVLHNAFWWYCNLNKKDESMLERIWCTPTLVQNFAEQHGGKIRQSWKCCIIKGIKIISYP